MITTLSGAIRAGLRCRCPRCGKGKLFAGFLTLRPRCEVCGLDYGFADSGDGPAVFIMFLAGFIVVGAALVTEVAVSPALLGPRGAVAASDPDRHAWAVAADEGIDDCAAVLSQGRREALRRRRAMSTPGKKRRSWVGLLIPALLAFVVLIGLGTWEAASPSAPRSIMPRKPWSSLRPRRSASTYPVHRCHAGPAGRRQNRDGQSRLRSRTPARRENSAARADNGADRPVIPSLVEQEAQYPGRTAQVRQARGDLPDNYLQYTLWRQRSGV